MLLKDPLKGAGTKGAYFAPLVPLLPFIKRKRGMEGTYAHDRRPGQNRHMPAEAAGTYSTIYLVYSI